MKKKNKQTIFEKLRLPLIALAVIAVIYGGLVLRDLKNQVKDLKKQNEAMSFKTQEISDKLSSLQNETDNIKSANDNLNKSLAAAQNQISSLQNYTGIKKVAGASTYKTAVKVETVTTTQVVESNSAIVSIDQIGKFNIELQANDTAFTVLQRAASQYNFAFDYTIDPVMGAFITGIGGIVPTGHQFWSFYYNNNSSQVGVSSQAISKGDLINFRIESW